jgi:hypothetical protein
VSSAPGMSGTRERPGQDASVELDQRLRGDVAALSEFARELDQLGSRSSDEPRSTASRASRGNEGLQRESGASVPGRVSADPETVEQGLARLVLALIDVIRRLLEKQAIRRIEAGSLSEDEIERMGETFLKLERKMDELKTTFGLQDEDLALNLGPLSDLLSEQ